MLTREKIFRVCSWNVLILISIYTSLRTLRDASSYSQLFSSTTLVPLSVSHALILCLSGLQLVSSGLLLWPRLELLKHGHVVALATLSVAFLSQLPMAIPSKTGRVRTVALVLASLLHLVRRASSRHASTMGADVDITRCDRINEHLTEAALRYKFWPLMTAMLLLQVGFYLYSAESLLFARHRLQRELAIEHTIDLFGNAVLFLTLGSFQTSKKSLSQNIYLDDDGMHDGYNGYNEASRVAKAKLFLSNGKDRLSRYWQGQGAGAKKSYKDL